MKKENFLKYRKLPAIARLLDFIRQKKITTKKFIEIERKLSENLFSFNFVLFSLDKFISKGSNKFEPVCVCVLIAILRILLTKKMESDATKAH
jgi:hypothetical protein